MMKKQRFCKSAVSLLLVFMMLVSMLTVGIVSTSAAETDVAETGADTIPIYFENNWLWTDVRIHFWGSSTVTNTVFPGNKMDKYKEYDSHDVYSYNLPSDVTGFLISGIKNDGSGTRNNSPDITSIPTKGTCYKMAYNDGNAVETQPITEMFPDYYLVGDFTSGGWSENENFKFKATNSANVVSVTTELSAGTYEFKVMQVCNYWGNDGTIEDTTEISSPGLGWTMSDTDGNCTLNASGGTYTFNFNTSTKKLIVLHESSEESSSGSSEDPTTGGSTDGMKTVYIGLIAWFNVSNLRVRYYNGNTIGGYVEPHDMKKNVSYQLADEYTNWDKPESFHIYAVQVPTSATTIEAGIYYADNDQFWPTHDRLTVDECTKDKILVLYKYSEVYYNVLYDYKTFTGEDEIPDDPFDYIVTANFTYTPTDGNSQIVTITPTNSSVTLNGEDAPWSYEVYIGDDKVSGDETYAKDQPFELDLGDYGEYEVKIRVIPEDTTKAKFSDPQTICYNQPEVTYSFDVSFSGEVNKENGLLTITPAISISYGDTPLTESQFGYYVYVDGEKTGELVTGNSTTTVLLTSRPEAYNVYIKAVVISDETNYKDSISKEFTYYVTETPDDEVTVTFMFKSSTAYRYIPYISVNGADSEPMTVTDNIIGYNETKTQIYKWYTYSINVPVGKDVELVFYNKYQMAASVTLLSTDLGQLKSYYFGCNNMHGGQVAVNLTDEEDEYRNWAKSVANMVEFDRDTAGVATTCLSDVVYKMGDADVDGDLTIMDATAIQLALVEKVQLSETGRKLADFNLSRVVSIMDVTDIQLALAQ